MHHAYDLFRFKHADSFPRHPPFTCMVWGDRAGCMIEAVSLSARWLSAHVSVHEVLKSHWKTPRSHCTEQHNKGSTAEAAVQMQRLCGSSRCLVVVQGGSGLVEDCSTQAFTGSFANSKCRSCSLGPRSRKQKVPLLGHSHVGLPQQQQYLQLHVSALQSCLHAMGASISLGCRGQRLHRQHCSSRSHRRFLSPVPYLLLPDIAALSG